MVLVDSWHEDEIKKIPRRKGPGRPDWLRPAIDRLTPAFTFVSVVRLLRPPIRTRPPKGLVREDWLLMQELRRQPKSLAAESSSGMTQDQSGMEARTAHGLDDRPLIVLTAGKVDFDASDPAEANAATEDQEIWIHDLQAQLATLSTRGKQIVVQGSTHGNSMGGSRRGRYAVKDVMQR